MWNGVWVGRGREWDHSFSPLSLEDETGLDWIAKARHPAVVQSNPPPRPTAAPAAPDGARPRWIRRRTPNWYDRALPVSLLLSSSTPSPLPNRQRRADLFTPDGRRRKKEGVRRGNRNASPSPLLLRLRSSVQRHSRATIDLGRPIEELAHRFIQEGNSFFSPQQIMNFYFITPIKTGD